MADLEKLSQMLDAIVNDKSEEAQVAFHGYSQTKMKDIIHGDQVDDEEDNKTEND